MAVFRVEKSHDYTVMANYHRRDERQSLKAVGLLSKILGLPEDWTYSVSGLTKICKDGKAAISSALKELEKAGYVCREQTHDDGGTFGRMEYVIREIPLGIEQDAQTPLTENRQTVVEGDVDSPFTDFPSTEKPSTENQPQLSTYSTKYVSNNTIPPYSPPVGGNPAAGGSALAGPRSAADPGYIPIPSESSTQAPGPPAEADETVSRRRFRPPQTEEVAAYCAARNNGIDPAAFMDFYESKGWMVGRNKMKNWQAAVRTWERKRKTTQEEVVPRKPLKLL